MNNRYALPNYPVDYEKFGLATELKQLEIIREVRKLRELVKDTVRSHFDHESYWTDGRNFYLLLEPYKVVEPELTDKLSFVRIPLAIAPYHQSRKKPKGFNPPMGTWLFGLPETKSELDCIQDDLEISASFGLYEP